MKTPKFLKLLARFSVLLASLAIFTVIITTGSFSKSTSPKPAAAPTTAPTAAQRPALQAATGKAKKSLESFLTPFVTLPSFFPASLLSPLPPPLPAVESIGTFAVDSSGCTNIPKTDFNFGEDVCVVVSNAPLGANERLIWGHTDGREARETFINSATISDTLTITPTTVIAGQTLDNKGTWRVESVDTDFAPVAVTFFTIHDPAAPTADLTVYKSGPAQVNENSDVSFTITVANQGPDAAQNVHLTDVVPGVTTFVSLGPNSGGFTCTGSECTAASLAKGAQVNFTAVYHTNGVASPTTTSYSASVASDPPSPTVPTAELHPADNSASGQFTINNTVTTGTCTLDCPDNINAIANTTESSVRGAHVTFASADPSGDCGAVTATPLSGSFFPVGTTTVTVTSETNGGSCSFTVTVEDQGVNPPTISCPANPPAANANGDCEAAVAVGTATATGNNVTVFGTRSDGKPMYTCDANGNCTRRSSDDTFSSGITTITWVAYSHNVAGPYADADAEEASRTGSAHCTQTVIVNDVTPPVITAVDSTVSADATCQAAVPDYTNSVTDNCSCSANDNSQDCISQQRITLTQDVAAGTMVGLGPHTIHLTANDGASNPGPDGIPETADDGTGNVTVKTITFTVNDTTAPVVTAPADSSASADSSCLAAVPNYTAGSTATDNCSGSITFSQSPAAGTMVGLGPTTVTVTGTDGAGNHGTDTVVFTVNDTTAPTITLNESGQNPQYVECHTSYPELGATAHDNCSGDFAATPSGTVDANTVGTYTITYNATDEAGNSATAVTRTVIVRDTIAPTITLTNFAPSMWPPNHKYQTFQVTQFVASVTDSCDTPLSVSSVVIEKVTSDEIENGNGDGNTLNDIIIASNCKSLQLRSEREGIGNGRVYSITFLVRDASGNTTRATARVVVPHNPGETVVDSGVHYTVNSSCP
jgi:uncharacterized repeat protein (TIGR01451 family)